MCTARVIGNGTSTDGLTSATAYGLQLKGKTSDYYFSVGVSTSFGLASNPTPDTKEYRGNGTVALLREAQEISQGNFGYLNRLMLVKSITDYVVEQTSTPLAMTGASDTVTFTQNSKVVTTGTGTIASGEIIAGDKIVVNGVTYGVAVADDGTVDELTLTEPFKGATVTYTASGSAVAEVLKAQGYDVIVIDHDIPVASQDNQNIHPKACETRIALPSYLTQSTAKTTFLAALNAWALTTPGRFATVTV